MSGFVITHINLSRGFRGGERQTVLLIQGLSKFNIEQRIICRKTSPLIFQLESIPNLSIQTVSDRPEARFLTLFKLDRKSNLIQVHETLAGQVAIFQHSFFHVPYVLTRRVDHRIRNNVFNKMMYSRAAECVGVSSVVSKIMEDTFNVSATTIHDAQSELEVNEKEASRIRKQWEGRFVIGHVGALVDSHKGQNTILEAAKRLQKVIPNLLIVFLGEGADKETLKRKAQGLPVEFLGFHDNVADYLSNFDVFAFPSNYEGLGSSILDAMNIGIPVVATNVGGIPDIIEDGVSGLLIERGNSNQLADKIIELRSNRNLKDQLVAGGHTVAKNHSVEAISQQYLALYEQVLRKTK